MSSTQREHVSDVKPRCTSHPSLMRMQPWPKTSPQGAEQCCVKHGQIIQDYSNSINGTVLLASYARQIHKTLVEA